MEDDALSAAKYIQELDVSDIADECLISGKQSTCPGITNSGKKNLFCSWSFWEYLV